MRQVQFPCSPLDPLPAPALASQQLQFRPVRVFCSRTRRRWRNNCRSARAVNERSAESSSRLASPGLVLPLQAVQNQGRAWGFLPRALQKGWRRQKHSRGTPRDRLSEVLWLVLSGTQTACESPEPPATFADPRRVLQRPGRLPVVLHADSRHALAGFGSGSSGFFLSAAQGSAQLCCELRPRAALWVSSWGTELGSSVSSPEFCFNDSGGWISSVRSGSGKEAPCGSRSRAPLPKDGLSRLPSRRWVLGHCSSNHPQGAEQGAQALPSPLAPAGTSLRFKWT